MSDEKPVHENHYCEHPGCKEWGGFGFSRPPKAPARWYCWEHRPAHLVTQP